MSDTDTYRKAVAALKQAGFALVRSERHEVWKSEDGMRGVALSHNVRDKHLVNRLFRSARLDARL